MRIFIVDDSLMIWSRIMEMLSDISGVQLVGVSGRVEEAIRKIHELKPDLVILDIRLYGGSGIDVLRSVKQDMPETIVAVFSNYTHPEYKKICEELGADYFLDKSKEFDKLPGILLKNV